MGFAFENYDAVGGWRDMDAGMPVDASGKFAFARGEVSFKNYVELSKAVAASSEARDCFAKQFLEYSLRRPAVKRGRGLHRGDRQCLQGRAVRPQGAGGRHHQDEGIHAPTASRR